jgi:hypothetical protein
MNIIQSSKSMDQSKPVGSLESRGHSRETTRIDGASASEQQAEGGSEIATDSANALLRQVAGTSFREIDRLIDELHALRDHLQDEGLRVQREIVKYAQLSQAAMKSTKVIAEGMMDGGRFDHDKDANRHPSDPRRYPWHFADADGPRCLRHRSYGPRGVPGTDMEYLLRPGRNCWYARKKQGRNADDAEYRETSWPGTKPPAVWPDVVGQPESFQQRWAPVAPVVNGQGQQ